MRWNATWTVLLSLAMASAVSAAGPQAGERRGVERQPAERSEPLVVISFNIRYDNPGDGPDAWPHRRDAVAEFLLDQQADLVGLQEALAGQVGDLNQRLAGYDCYGVGRDDGRQRGEQVPIYYRRERFEQLDRGTFWLSETPDEAGSRGWDAALPRIVSWVKLRDRAGGTRFFFFNTHFDHRGAAAREQSARLIREKIARLAGSHPVVLAGDFNCLPADPPLQVLLAEAGPDDDATRPPPGSRPALRDALDASESPHVGPDSTWNAFRQIAPGRRIDFILVSPQVRVIRHEIPEARTPAGRFLSDHLPVVAEIEMESRQP